jgi:hypothetical protein
MDCVLGGKVLRSSCKNNDPRFISCHRFFFKLLFERDHSSNFLLDGLQSKNWSSSSRPLHRDLGK